ncbi:metallophosphoesterase [Novosphingobium sp. 9]|uniref:metallophosphoesterase n=1 Tax=Novosphingobium sp. 9 TaxID=2025349 RepID=UPI0021B5CE93|nr:metallophosphoesterase [Novosphingobium sp. 9]
MFHLIFALPWAYVVARTLLPLPWALGVKLAVALILLVGAQSHLWSRISSGSVFSPEFPRPLIVVLNWLFGCIAQLAVFQIALDVVRLAATITGIGADAPWIEARYAIAVLALVLAAIGVWNAIGVPRLRKVTVTIPALPEAFEGYTLIQLTDLHISRLFPAGWTRAVVEATNRLDADLIVVTGDVIDGSVDNRRTGVEPLRELRAKDGVYLCPGNHEYLSGYDPWMAHLASLGMRVLGNAHAVIARGDEALVVAGLTDPSARGVGKPLPDLGQALEGSPPDAPIILLDHEPGRAQEAARRGVALQLSGHTHGGMIVGLDRLVARGNSGFVSGLYEVGTMALYVNNGTGIWPGFALRLGKPSELTLITLHRATG